MATFFTYQARLLEGIQLDSPLTGWLHGEDYRLLLWFALYHNISTVSILSESSVTGEGSYIIVFNYLHGVVVSLDWTSFGQRFEEMVGAATRGCAHPLNDHRRSRVERLPGFTCYWMAEKCNDSSVVEEPGDQSFGLLELVTFAYCNGENYSTSTQLPMCPCLAKSTHCFGICKVEQFPYHLSLYKLYWGGPHFIVFVLGCAWVLILNSNCFTKLGWFFRKPRQQRYDIQHQVY